MESGIGKVNVEFTDSEMSYNNEVEIEHTSVKGIQNNTMGTQNVGLVNKNKSSYCYKYLDAAPYEVYVQHKSKNVGNYSFLALAKMIYNMNLKDLKKIVLVLNSNHFNQPMLL